MLSFIRAMKLVAVVFIAAAALAGAPTEFVLKPARSDCILSRLALLLASGAAAGP